MMKGWNAYLRRTLSFALAVCMVMSMTMPAIAEGEEGHNHEPAPTSEVCNHVYEEVSQTSAENHKVGQRVLRCVKCQDEKTEVIPALHNAPMGEAKVIVDPGYHTKGVKARYCPIEGCSYKEETEIPALHKDYESGTWVGTEVTPATAHTDGTTLYKCPFFAECGASKEVTVPKDHEASYEITSQYNAQEDHIAVKVVYTCKYEKEDGTACGLSYGVDYAPKHEASMTYTEDTAEDHKEGVKVWTCSECDESDEVTTPALHASSMVHVDTATCKAAGESYDYCSACGIETSKTNVQDSPIKPHTYVWTVTKAATCTEAGEEKYICSDCETIDESAGINTLPAAGAHDYQWKVDTEANCMQEGTGHYECIKCEAVDTSKGTNGVVAIPKNNQHNLTSQEIQQPTCTVQGKREERCLNEGCTYQNIVFVNPVGHKFDAAPVVIEDVATVNCTEGQPGATGYWVDQYTCTICNEATKEVRHDHEAFTHDFATITYNYKSGKCTDKNGATYTVTKTCVCGYSETTEEQISKACDYEETKNTATCAAGGKQTLKCKVCGSTTTKNSPALGHIYDNGVVTTEPSCETTGVKTYTCTRSGCTASTSGHTKTEVIPQSHEWNAGEITTAPTCTTTGVKTFQCVKDGCEATRTETVAKVTTPEGHDLPETGTVIKAATCASEGTTRYTCKRCGKPVDIKSPKVDHTWSEGVRSAEPTCDVAGSDKFTCTVCGETKLEPVAALGHTDSYFADKSEGVLVTSATCTAAAVYNYTCERCHNSHSEIKGEPLPHDYQELTAQRVNATCETDGREAFQCASCGHRKEQAIPATGHDYQEDTANSVKSTCAVSGYKLMVCSHANCEKPQRKDYQVMTEHTWNNGETTTEATCVAPGVMTYKCTVCDATKTETIAIKTADDDHSWVKSAETEATCTNPGKITYTCSVCHGSKTVTAPVAEHDWDEGEVSTPATCSTPGVKTYTCDSCHTTKLETISPTGEHQWDNGVVKVAATCAEKGVMEYTCTTCTGDSPAKMTEAIPMRSHDSISVKDANGVCAVTYCPDCGAQIGTGIHKFETGDVMSADGVGGWRYGFAVVCKNCSYISEKVYDAENYEITQAENSNAYTVTYTTADGPQTMTGTVASGVAQVQPADVATHTVTETVPATCHSAGHITYRCSENCTDSTHTGNTYTVEIPTTGEHNLSAVQEDATCEAAGSVYYECKNEGCDYQTDSEPLPRLPHTYKLSDDKTETYPATCTTVGLETYKCSCGASTTQEIPKVSHTYVEETTAATCYSEGSSSYTCSVCGHTDATKSQTFPKLPHSYIKMSETKATCIKAGVVTYECTAEGCTAAVEGHTMVEHLPMIAHKYEAVAYDPSKSVAQNLSYPATCTRTGKTTYKCTQDGCQATKLETISRLAHVKDVPKQENRVEPTCTATGSYDLVYYCKDCMQELSRQKITIAALGHEAGKMQIEDLVTAKCLEDGGYNAVTRCAREGCNAVVSSIPMVLPKHGHLAKPSAEENRMNGSCLGLGGYDMVVRCFYCNSALESTHYDLPAIGHTEPTLVNIVLATENEDGYTGDYMCPRCNEILAPGTIFPRLSLGENEIDPQLIMDALHEEIHLDDTAVENLKVLAHENGNNALSLLKSVNGTMNALALELEKGTINEAEYERGVKVANVATGAAMAVGAGAGTATNKAKELNEALPANAEMNMGGTVKDFYQRQFDGILGTETPTIKTVSAFDGDMSGVKLVFVAGGNLMSSGIDLTLEPEVYDNAMTFVDDSVNKMTDAAATLRSCSGQAMIASVKQYIEKVAVSSFRDFDKEAADEEFLQNAYDAILLNMQQQVSLSLTEAYEEASKSGKFTGTAKTELDKRYEEQMAAVADIETFEIMVLEVMRQKYVSVLNTQLEAGTITRESYDAAWANAVDVETFEPIYWAIFRAWALNEESEYPMTLQELTDATIADTTYATTHIELRDGLSSQEIKFLTAAVVLFLLLGAAYIVSNSMNKRKVVA